MDMRTLLYLKWMSSKNRLCGTGNSAQCSAAAWTGGESGGEGIRVHIRLRPFAVHLNHHIVCSSLVPQYKIKSFKKCVPCFLCQYCSELPQKKK